MKNIVNIAKHSLKMFFGSPFSAALLAAPVLVTILLIKMLSSNEMVSAAQIGVVMPKTVIGADVLLNELQKSMSFNFLDEKTALSRLKQKRLNGIIILHSDNLVRDIAANKNSIEVIGLTDDQAAKFISGQLDEALNTIQTFIQLSHGDEKTFEKLYGDYKSKTKEVNIEHADFELTKSSMVFGMYVMIFLFTCIKGLQSMIQEKENKVYERICMSSIRKHEYILGHILGAFSVLMLQIVVQGIIMKKLGLTFGLGLPAFIGICIVLGIVGISLSLIILACSKNTQGYFIIGSFVVSPLCMLSDCIFPKEFLPDSINKISLLSPIRWVMILYKDVLTGGRETEILTSTAVALGLSVVLILMGIIIETSKKTV